MLYRVKISDDNKKNIKTIDIKIDTYEEFIKWFSVFKTFEREKNISFETIENDEAQENSIF